MASAMALQLRSLNLEVNEIIGKGAYGIVYKARFLGSKCAAKVIHAAPLSLLENQADQASLRRFEQECQFMNSLKHTNLVQSMGTVTLDYPVLVMELMDCNLNVYLERNKDMPFQMEVSIADDVINGIRYLHHENVVHRDISGANILMTGSTAKLSDLGMAKLLSAFQPNQLTPCPGNIVYMPFSAIFGNITYDEKIDIYSYGVVLIQIMTKKLPDPSQQWKDVNGQKIFPSEIERRQNHLVEIANEHPLKEIAIYCLQDEQKNRPTAVVIQEWMENIKTSKIYREKIQDMQLVRRDDIFQVVQENQILYAAKQRNEIQIQQLEMRVEQLELGAQQRQQREQSLSDQWMQEKAMMEQMREEDRKVMREEFQMQLEQFAKILHEKALEEIKENKSKCEQAAQERIQENETKCLHLIEQTQRKALIVQAQADKVAEEKQQLEEENQRLEESLRTQLILEEQSRSGSFSSSIATSPSDTHLSVSRNNFTPVLLLNTDTCTASKKLHRDTAAVVHNEAIYVRPARTKDIHKYVHGNWSLLLECKVDNCSLAIVKGSLVTIGGRTSSLEVVPHLYKVTTMWEETDVFPPMPTARELSLTITSGKTLVVVGGRDKKGNMLTVVEVFYEDNQQWQTACDLLFPLYFATATTYGESLIIHGMKQKQEPVVSLSCKLTDLICSCTRGDNIVNIWNCEVLKIPSKSSLIKFDHHLLAVGGQTPDNQATGAVFLYNPNVNDWIEIGFLNTPRYLCFTVVMSQYLYVIGGDVGSNSLTNSVEIGIFQ